ncbi:portal protein [Brucella pseudogrignonensis]
MTDDDDDKSPVEQAGESDPSRLDREALTRRLKGWYRQDVTHANEWRKEAREDYAFYNGDQWSQADEQALKEQGRPVMTFNRVAPLVNAVRGSEVNNRREVRFIPRQLGAAEANELLTSAGEWFRDETDGESVDSDAFEDVSICGMGWTDTRIDFDDNPDGAPCMSRLDPLKFVWDKNAVKPNLEDVMHLFYVDEKPLSEVQEMFPDIAPEMLHAGWAKSLMDDPTGLHDQTEANFYTGDQNDIADQYQNNLCTIVECRWLERETYYRGPDMQTGQMREYSKQQIDLLTKNIPGFKHVKQRRKVVKRAFIGREVLGDPDKPLIPAGTFGWECITGYRDKLKKQFYGVVRPTKDPQRWSNKFFSQVMYLLNSQSKGGIIAERGAFEDDRQAEESWSRADSITWAKQGKLSADAIQPKPTAQFPTGFFQLFNESKEAINDVTGLSAEFIGTREVDQPGILEQTRKQSSLNLLASLFDSLRRYRKRQGKIILHLIQNYLSDGRLIRIVGQDKQEYVPLVRPDKTNIEYEIIVDDAPTSPNEKEQTWAVLQQMMPLLQNEMTPDVMLQMLKYSPLPATLVDQWTKELQQKQQEQAQQPPPPDPRQQELQMRVAEKQADLQHKQAKNQLDQQSGQIALYVQQQQAQMDLQTTQAKNQLAQQRLAIDATQNAIRQRNADANVTRAAGGR